MISLTFGDLERSDQGHLLENRLSVRDIVTEVFIYLFIFIYFHFINMYISFGEFEQ